MTREEIDALWQKAMHSAIKSNEPSTRYEFANLILEKAADMKQEVVFVFTDDTAGLSKESSDVIKYYCEAIRSMKT